MFYKVAASTVLVLLYSCKTWSITSSMFAVLESFHHHVARQLTHCHAFYLCHADLWVLPSITVTLNEAGMFTLREYISHCREYILPYSETHHLLAQCHQAGCGSYPNQHFWWDGPLTSSNIRLVETVPLIDNQCPKVSVYNLERSESRPKLAGTVPVAGK